MRADLGDLHRAWAAYRYAHDEHVELNARPAVGRELAIDVLIFLPDDEDDAPQTWFATAGLSRLDIVSDVGPFELEIAVRGRFDRATRDAMARRVGELGIAPLKRGAVVRRDTLWREVALPLFPRRHAAVWVDAGWSTPEYLPGLTPRVRVLEGFMLHPAEADAYEALGAAETIERLRDAGVDLIAPDRPPVDLHHQAPAPARPRLSPVPSGAMSTAEETHDVAALWKDIDGWLSASAPGTFRRLKPGAPPDAIAAVEAAVGRTLPADLAASYAAHDGYTYLTDYEYLPSATALKMWRGQQSLPGGRTKPTRSAHQGKMKAVNWHELWFPIAMDSGGNFLCVDLDPEPSGTYGQVIFWDAGEGPRLSAHPSWGSWLERYRDALLAGKIEVDEDGRIVPPTDL